MKRLLTILTVFLLVAGFSFEGLAANTFDVSAVSSFEASVSEDDAVSGSIGLQTNPLLTFARTFKDKAVASLAHEFGFQPVHGQPLPGVLISLLLGAAFGLARKFRNGRRNAHSEQTTEDMLLLTARLLRMQVSYLYPPETIHTISPGPDLFCQRE